jgi:hypothetical protein
MNTGLNRRGFEGTQLLNKKRCLIMVIVVAVVVLFVVRFDTMSVNRQPIITSLEAEPDWTTPLGSLQVMCNAIDPDGNMLSYNWSASKGRISGTDAAVNWTAPSHEGSYSITVKVTDGLGGEVTKTVTIEVTVNKPPKINSLIANADWTMPLGSLQVTCDAIDPEGDELSYEWAADGGEISGISAVVNWFAPQEVGAYNVTLVARDSQGEEATRWLTLHVNAESPPVIEDLIVRAKEPKYLIKTSSGYTVMRTKEYDIECTVSDTIEAVFYAWSCSGGNISGESSIITWTAPQSAIDSEVIVRVIVSDGAGNSMNKGIIFEVIHCPSCFE